jgi:hypothetical protein
MNLKKFKSASENPFDPRSVSGADETIDSTVGRRLVRKVPRIVTQRDTEKTQRFTERKIKIGIFVDKLNAAGS